MNTFKLTAVAAFMFLLYPSRGRGQQVEVYTDGRSNKYAAINLTEMFSYVEDRNANSDFYTEVQLFEIDQTTAVKNADGEDVYVKRITRHYTNAQYVRAPDINLSRRFILSPQLISSDGTTSGTVSTVTWAQANGYLNAANSQKFNNPPPEASAAVTGCSAYRGKDEQDAQGTWRVPTHREGAIILAFRKELEETKGTEFVPFSRSTTTATRYWLATEFYGSTEAWYMSFSSETTDILLDKEKKEKGYYLRCIRDIEVE